MGVTVQSPYSHHTVTTDSVVFIMTANTIAVLITLVCLSSVLAMKERSKELRDRRIEDVSWFLVAENDTEACVEVDEDANADIINGSPIADECKNDGDRFCFCGKKGLRSTKTWKYLCGECRANKPFSFKVEKPSRGRGKGRQGRKSPCEDGKRPECVDGSRPGRPTEEGGPPLCQDGSSPVCSDGSPPARPSPCGDNSQPTCNGEDPVCGDGSAFQEFGPVCSKRQGKPRCSDDSVRPLCDDGSRPRGGRGGPPKGRGGTAGRGQGARRGEGGERG